MSSRVSQSYLNAIARGPQDIYLTGDPQVTFYKVIYERHNKEEKEDDTTNNDDIIDEHIVSLDCSCNECNNTEFVIEI